MGTGIRILQRRHYGEAKTKSVSVNGVPTAIKLSNVEKKDGWVFGGLTLESPTGASCDLIPAGSTHNLKLTDDVFTLQNCALPCVEPTPAPPQVCSYTLSASTGSGQWDPTTSSVAVSWQLNGMWAQESQFFKGAAMGEAKIKSVTVNGVPTAIKLNNVEKKDGWIFGGLMLTSPTGASCALVPAGSTHNLKATDDVFSLSSCALPCVESTPAPPQACSYTLSATTGSEQWDPTTASVAVSWQLNGEWAQESEFFTGSSMGEVMTKPVTVNGVPTAILLSNVGKQDGWRFGGLTLASSTGAVCELVPHSSPHLLKLTNDVFPLASCALPSPCVQQGSAPPAPPTPAPPVCSYTLSSTTGSGEWDGTAARVAIAWKINHVWAEESEFFTGASAGEVKSKSVALNVVPTGLKLSNVERQDGWGFGGLTLTTSNAGTPCTLISAGSSHMLKLADDTFDLSVCSLDC